MDMGVLLGELDLLAKRLPDRSYLAPPATADAIARVEEAIGRALPEVYKQFLLAHDGGFVASFSFDSRDRNDFESAQWNANHLYGCADIIREYIDQALRARDVDPTLVDWPYVPFCRTDGQEFLVFGPPGLDGLHPILDAFHEIWCHEWQVLAPNFSAFLEDYIQSDGEPTTIA